MQRLKTLSTVLLVVVAMTACIAYAAQEKRSVVLEIGLPNGAAPQLRIADGETGTVSLPSIGTYGFVPTLRDGAVTVDLFDLNQTPSKQMARMEVVIGGESVRSDTDPQFSVRVLRVVAQ